jgi:tight adherence protein C
MGLLLFGTLLFVLAVVVVVVASLMGSTQSTGVARSLELLNQTATTREVSKNELGLQDRVLGPMLNRLRGLAVRVSPAGAGSRMVRNLDRAGNPAAWSVERIMGAKGLGLVIGVILALLIVGFSVKGLVIAAAAGAVGFFMPDLLLYNAGAKRQQELQKGLADALDMLTVCVEAGQGFDAAILQVARPVTGPIGGEFARVLSEIQIGKSRADAFA